MLTCKSPLGAAAGAGAFTEHGFPFSSTWHAHMLQSSTLVPFHAFTVINLLNPGSYCACPRVLWRLGVGGQGVVKFL